MTPCTPAEAASQARPEGQLWPDRSLRLQLAPSDGAALDAKVQSPLGEVQTHATMAATAQPLLIGHDYAAVVNPTAVRLKSLRIFNLLPMSTQARHRTGPPAWYHCHWAGVAPGRIPWPLTGSCRRRLARHAARVQHPSGSGPTRQEPRMLLPLVPLLKELWCAFASQYRHTRFRRHAEATAALRLRWLVIAWLQQCPPVAEFMPPAHDCMGNGIADSEHLSVMRSPGQHTAVRSPDARLRHGAGLGVDPPDRVLSASLRGTMTARNQDSQRLALTVSCSPCCSQHIGATARQAA